MHLERRTFNDDASSGAQPSPSHWHEVMVLEAHAITIVCCYLIPSHAAAVTPSIADIANRSRHAGMVVREVDLINLLPHSIPREGIYLSFQAVLLSFIFLLSHPSPCIFKSKPLVGPIRSHPQDAPRTHLKQTRSRVPHPSDIACKQPYQEDTPG